MGYTNSIAITGLSCRFPGDGDNLDNFWESICSGKSAWSKVPPERFNVDAFWSPSNNRNTSITQGAHFLKDDISKFDANFFSIPRNDVVAMDPQQRIMIEIAYEALEKAGLPLDKIACTKTGVFMGHFTSDYKEMIYRDPDNAPSHSITGSCKTSLANRISWLWDLRGPSLTVDTACSSSLVALHLACQSLLTEESDIAIVGGTSLLLNPEMFMYLSNQGFLSRDGKCKSFDESADGYDRGEGFGTVILKRVDDAISAGDPIRAVIRGTGSNQDGHTKGFTLPSADAQSALIHETYRRAGVCMRDTGYVEAHGTGTQAGDVQEMEALARTIAKSHTNDTKLIVGSVKSNIGHLEAAAGIAGIIKAVLILENGLIPPSINFTKGNLKIKFDEWNTQVPTEVIPWPSCGVRRISTNSFGYGGTNAHAILEDAYHYLKERNVSGNSYSKAASTEKAANNAENDVNVVYSRITREESRLFALSAQDKDGLKRVKSSLARYVELKDTEFESESDNAETFMSALAYTLSEKRSRLQWKTYIIASSLNELSTALEEEENSALVAQSSRKPRIGFIFTGQGAQWPHMGIELMVWKEFKESVVAADLYLRKKCECPWSAAEELQKGKSVSQLHLAEFSQTLCTVLQIALVDLLKEWNVSPTAVVGHSSGEIAAAYCMGALTREDAWKIAYYRGVLSSDMKIIAPDQDGSMMSVGLSREKAEEWIARITDTEVVVACINSPASVTLSGDTQCINQLLFLLKEEGVFARKLQVDTAYHSHHMHVVAQRYYEVLADVTTLQTTGDCTMHSSVTGELIDASQLGVVNWVKNLTSPVLFSTAVYDMLRPLKGNKRVDENAVDVLVEIGPHSALRGPTAQTLRAHGITDIPYHPVITRNQNSFETALDLAGALFALGAPVNIQQINGRGSKHIAKPLVDLPSYPWNHSQRYWHDSRVEKEYLSRGKPKLSLLGSPCPALGDGERLWRGIVRLSEEPWISDHKMQGSILYPGAGYLAMALEAFSQRVDDTQNIAAYKLRDCQLTSAAIISEGSELEFIVKLRPHISGTRASFATWTEFVITSSPDGVSLVKNCSGLITVEYESAEGSQMRYERDCELETSRNQYLEAKKLCKNPISSKHFYTHLASLGHEYGPNFINLSDIYNRDGQSVCAVQIPDIPARTFDGFDRPHVIHPGVLDSIFHLAFAAVNGSKMDLRTTMVPKFIDEVTISANVPFKPGTKLRGYSNSNRHGFKELNSEIIMLDENERHPVIEISGLLCAEVATARFSNSDDITSKSITSKLIWRPAIEVLTFKEQQTALEMSRDKVSEYLKLLHHSNPGLSVLEFIPGYRHSNPRVQSVKLSGLRRVLKTGSVTIAFQDVTLKTEFQKDPELDPRVAVELFDINHDISAKTLKERGYDVILTSCLTKNASNLEMIVEFISKLLKNEGKMCVLEVDFLTEKTRDLLHKVHMETMVIENVEMTQSNQLNLVIAEKTKASHTESTTLTSGPEQVMLIQVADPSQRAQAVASDLATSLGKSGRLVIPFFWGSDLSLLRHKSCISLVELEKPLLRDLTEPDFASIQKLILGATKILWAVGFNDPGASMVDGLARTVRNEMPGLSFRTFHAEEQYALSAAGIGDLIARSFSSTTEDDEYFVKDHILHVGRVEEDEALNDQVNDILYRTHEKISSLPLNQVQYPTRPCIRNPGMLDSLCLEPDDVPGTELEDDFIEIQVRATALNFREIMVAMGQIIDSKLGLDAAGVVRRVGSAVKKFKVGDRVAMYGHGSHRTLHRSRADYCALIPEGLSFEQAASIPTVHGTAWNALVRLAKVQKGQSILIHAAAGGVGQAAIQVAKYFEMEIFATVSSEAKSKLIQDEYGVPDDHIFNSRDLSFVKGIKRMTSGRGVDVILNSLSGEILRQTWYCIAPFGHFIEIGLKDIIATGKQLGKIALTWGDDDIVPVIQHNRNTLKLDPNGVYMLAGGLGGLGRSISTKLVDLGARKLCFLSRSGCESVHAKKLARELEERNVQMRVYKCDIADQKALVAAIDSCKVEMGDIRGVFQCAMVLQDTLFMNMSYQQWMECTRPKVQGSWNLHQELPDVDIFITLSSFSAIFGNRGQSNYAAAGAYEDALAYHRRAHNQHAITLDLGIMRDVGVLAETGITDSLREWEKPYGIRETEFLALIERVIAGDMAGTLAPQILTGLATGGSAIAAGIDTPFYLNNARFAIMAKTGVRGQKSATSSSSIAPHILISQAKSLEEAGTYVLKALRDVVAKMLQTTVSEIDTGRFLHSYGIDSLVAIEIVNWALKEVKSDVTVFDVLAGVPITTLSNKMATKSAALRKELVEM